jgi:hypothetical protein
MIKMFFQPPPAYNVRSVLQGTQYPSDEQIQSYFRKHPSLCTSQEELQDSRLRAKFSAAFAKLPRLSSLVIGSQFRYLDTRGHVTEISSMMRSILHETGLGPAGAHEEGGTFHPEQLTAMLSAVPQKSIKLETFLFEQVPAAFFSSLVVDTPTTHSVFVQLKELKI